MMKNHQALCLGLATLLVVPAVGSRGQDDLDLLGRLSRTVQAIEELAGIQSKIAAGDRSGIDSILAATEKATLGPEERDEYLARLREDVSHLRMTYDKAVAADPARAAKHFPSPTDDGSRRDAFPIATTGLDPEARQTLSGTLGPLDRNGNSVSRSRSKNGPQRAGQRRSLESDPLFTADAVRQGRLLVRARRYSEAAEILRPHVEDVGGRYWLGRATSELGFLTEAVELLESVKADPEAGSYASRAELDLRFLTVRRDLERRGVSKDPK
jgi:hypothetical protein